MRKAVLFVVLTVMILVFCTGCNGKNGGILSKKPDLNVPFETDIRAQAGELEFEGSMKRYGTGIWEMSITAPETLAGLTVFYNDDGVKAKLGELSLDIPAEDIRDGAVFAQIFKAMDSAALSEALTYADTEDGKTLTGEFAGGEYTVTFEPESLVPVRIEIPSAGISGELTNFSIMTAETETAVESGT